MEENSIKKDLGTVIMLANCCLSITLVLLITIIFPSWTVFFGSWIIVPALVFLINRKK